VCRSHQHLVHRDAAPLRCVGLGFIAGFLCHADIVNNHQGQRGRAVVEHQRAGVERIVGTFRHPGREQPRHVEGKQFRRDVHRRRAGAERGDTSPGSLARNTQEAEGHKEEKGAFHIQ
jgi:hypothetical protein